MHDYFTDWHWGFGLGHWGIGILFWITIIALVVVSIRKFTTAGNGPSNADDPIRILKRRYARGEIDKKEFQARKRDLTG
uniref:Putative membrane protein n=1 Tax=Candidatus Kentrum sp. DK TaxID=2126562 RepID=A0A450SIY4_9GAMM|nr:MAG: putative membrane protein [Candidatus Kentron sp. DK]